ncbi:Vmc-like lipoprotein signal peptide domain-containing protein [Ureaplasma zalophigenitalium]|uniref:Lipoprotein n=1 Tax=Ureaplasma zalophigenitalium TaxID=907723 RepID=A0ABT3BNF8_9BACT|nr:hypothetical protein [Ureaplasma zalophigenitalium]MCV3753782.1 hypothetical protein [Ureaplasma zalophigenitalium]
MKKINKKFFLSMLGGIAVCGLAAGIATSCKNNNELITAVNEYNNYVSQIKTTDFYKKNTVNAQEIDKILKITKDEIDKHKKDANFIVILNDKLSSLKTKIDPMVKTFNAFVELNKKVQVGYKNANKILFADATVDGKNFTLTHPEVKIEFVKADKKENSIVVSYIIKNQNKEQSTVFTKEIPSSLFKVDFESANRGTSVTYKGASEVTFTDASLVVDNYQLNVSDNTFTIAFISAQKAADKSRITVSYKLSKNNQEHQFTKDILADVFKKEAPKVEPIDFESANKEVTITYKGANEVTFTDASIEVSNYQSNVPDKTYVLNVKDVKKDETNKKIIVSYTLTKNLQESNVYIKEIPESNFKSKKTSM